MSTEMSSKATAATLAKCSIDEPRLKGWHQPILVNQLYIYIMFESIESNPYTKFHLVENSGFLQYPFFAVIGWIDVVQQGVS